MSEEEKGSEPGGVDYQEAKHEGYRCVWHPDFPLVATLPLIESLQLNQPPESARLIQSEKGRSVWLVSDYPEVGRSVVVKCYQRRRPHDAVTYVIRETKAEIEWFFGTSFPEYDIAVPQALACGVQRKWGLWNSAFFVMEAIDPCQTLLDYVKVPDQHLHAVIKDVARNVAKMHELGVLYRDLHGNNILIQAKDDGPPRVAFIDYHKAANTEKRVPDIFSMRDLAKLNMFCHTSLRSRRRFLVAYLRARGLLTRSTLHLWHEQVDRFSQEWWTEHEAAKGEDLRVY